MYYKFREINKKFYLFNNDETIGMYLFENFYDAPGFRPENEIAKQLKELLKKQGFADYAFTLTLLNYYFKTEFVAFTTDNKILIKEPIIN